MVPDFDNVSEKAPRGREKKGQNKIQEIEARGGVAAGKSEVLHGWPD